jgi:predicted transporter
MLFVGLYFLASAIVIPNISTAMTSKASPLTIPSLNVVAGVIVALVLLIGLGIFMTRKRSILVKG